MPAILALLLLHQSLLGFSISAALIGWALALLLTVPGYALRQLGAGDVKMLSAMGLLSDWQFMLISFAVAGLIAGGVTLFWLASQRYFPYLNLKLERFGLQLPVMPTFHGRKLPFGAMLAVGGVLSCWIFN